MNTVALSGVSIAPDRMLAGMKLGVKRGNVVYVPPAFHDLLKSAKTEREIVALLKSFKFLDLDPQPQHDPQWWIDTAQILSAQLADKIN
jgi:hypothetical protein